MVLYDAYSRSVLEWPVVAWGTASAEALTIISVMETRAHHFALGGGSSTSIYREGLAALFGGGSDVHLVMSHVRVALLHAENVARYEVHRTVQREMLVLSEGRRRVAHTMSGV